MAKMEKIPRFNWVMSMLLVILALVFIMLLAEYANLEILNVVSGLGGIIVMLTFFYVIIETNMVKIKDKRR